MIKTQPVPASYQQNEEAKALSLEITPTGEEGEQYYFNWFCNSENSTSGGTKMTAESDSVSSKTTPLTDTLGTNYYYCAVTRVVHGRVSKTVYSDVIPIAITIPLNGKGIESAPYELSKEEDLELLYDLIKR